MYVYQRSLVSVSGSAPDRTNQLGQKDHHVRPIYILLQLVKDLVPNSDEYYRYSSTPLSFLLDIM